MFVFNIGKQGVVYGTNIVAAQIAIFITGDTAQNLLVKGANRVVGGFIHLTQNFRFNQIFFGNGVEAGIKSELYNINLVFIKRGFAGVLLCPLIGLVQAGNTSQ